MRKGLLLSRKGARGKCSGLIIINLRYVKMIYLIVLVRFFVIFFPILLLLFYAKRTSAVMKRSSGYR